MGSFRLFITKLSAERLCHDGLDESRGFVEWSSGVYKMHWEGRCVSGELCIQGEDPDTRRGVLPLLSDLQFSDTRNENESTSSLLSLSSRCQTSPPSHMIT